MSRKTKKFYYTFFIALYFMYTLFLFGCYELNDGDEEAYFACFDAQSEFVSYQRGASIQYDRVKFSKFTEGDEDVFLVENESLLEYKAYRFFQIKIEQECVLSEVCLFVKWSKNLSGTNASPFLTINVYRADEKVDTEPLDSDGYGGLLAGALKFDKTEPDASIPMVNNNWDSGSLISFTPMNMNANDYFIICFNQNNDFIEELSDPGDPSSMLVYNDVTDNDLSFICDKIMFRVD